MPRFFFPTATDGVIVDDDVGTEHEHEESAMKEGEIHAREMAIERLKQGETDFEEKVEIRDAKGGILGVRRIKVSSS